MNTNNTTINKPLQVVLLNIFGEPASKANSRKIVVIHGMTRVIKSQKALTYSDAFKLQCPVRADLLDGDLRVTMVITYASRRPDLDDSLILDLMQGRVYLNDRQIKERHLFWRLDPDNPRTVIRVEQIEDICPKKKPAKKGPAKPRISGRGLGRSNTERATTGKQPALPF